MKSLSMGSGVGKYREQGRHKMEVLKPVTTVGSTPLGNSDIAKCTSELSPSRRKEDGGFVHQILVCYWMREASGH